jgi:hypothetical protein
MLQRRRDICGGAVGVSNDHLGSVAEVLIAYGNLLDKDARGRPRYAPRGDLFSPRVFTVSLPALKRDVQCA